MSEKFCLKWNDFHSNVSKSFGLFRNEKYLHDVTLVSDDHNKISAHKLVLSASSDYFRDIFKNNQHPHPLLCLDGISSEDLKNIMDYIYNGEVKIYQEGIERFLTVAQRLKIEGLIGDDTKEEIDTHNTPKEEFVQSNHEEPIVENKTSIHLEKNATKKKQESYVRTIATTNSFEDKNLINDQVFQYLEESSDGAYKCTFCGKTTSNSNSHKAGQKQHMMNHIETHMEGVTYNCPICQKSFRSKNSLSSHKSQTHK